jgi:hypothetical protein
MLTVYLYNAPKPPGCFDLSLEPMSSLADVALGIFSHHKTATIWFGYLEGWMLDQTDETRMRSVIRAFDCHVVSREPLSFSHAWKNEMSAIHLQEMHGDSDTHDNGGSLHGERAPEHEPSSGVATLDRVNHQN